MMRVIKLGLVVAVLATFAIGQGRRQDQPLTDELYRLEETRTKLIQDSIAKTTNEWAGTYSAGDHHPTVFLWTSDQGFLVTSSLHTFSSSWINYGSVTLTDTLLTIRPELSKDNQYAHVMETEYRLVRWDKHHFLIPPEELKRFAYAVHTQSGWEIIHYFSKWQDRDKPRRGLPDLPAEYVGIMKMPPVKARITAVGPDEGEQSVTINVGRNRRVIEGMAFYYLAKNGAGFSVRVTEVSETSSRASVGSIFSRGDAEVELKKGLRLSSRMPKNFVEPG